MKTKTLELTQYVYLVGNVKLNRYKIGRTHDLAKRVRAIDNSLPFRVVLLAHAVTHQGEILEQDTHLRFTRYRTRGEWFEGLDIVEVATFMTERAKFYGN